MSTMQEQLQQVKQQMRQQVEPAKPIKAKQPVKPTRPPVKTEKPGLWKVSPKHQQPAQQPAAVAKPAQSDSAGKKRRHKNGNKKKILRLVTHWPNGFSLNSIHPLREGIHGTLFADAITRNLAITPNQIRYSLSAYTRRTGYIKALAAGGSRYDLNGQPHGEVSAEHQQDAINRLAEMKLHTGDAKHE